MFKNNQYRAVIFWLLSGCFIIYLMIVVGCLTRLTHSGLSITEWGVMGTLPPLNENQWQEVFSKYQQTPEFNEVNYEMNIEQFKSIFWWEWTHRFIGRTILSGVFILGFLYFFIRKKLNQKLKKRFIFLFFLGAFQGVIGGWMVASGLNKIPAVSHYRLALHLMSAFTVFAFTFWFALDLIFENSNDSKNSSNSKLKPWLVTLFVVVIIQIIFGAFTAGFVELSDENKPLFRPGQIFNTWPKMGENWVADQVFSKSSFFENCFENASGIQFIHRTFAFFVVALVIVVWSKSNKFNLSKPQYNGITLLIYGITIQFLLGIFTLIYQVPLILGVLHQTGAFFLFVICIFLLHQFSYNKKNIS
jgi:cytochrome c oxidase assembly protein subunit 15